MQLYCERHGKGHPLLILHGLFGSLDNWRTLSKTFGRSFAVFAIDLRNHGRSPHSDVFNYCIMAEDLHEFMQQQSLSSAYLLGHSMGGKTAMQFAGTYPDMVDKLIIVDIAPKAYPPGHEEIFAALSALDVKAIRTRQEADAALAERISDAPLRQFLLKNLDRETSGGFRWKINLDALFTHYEEILQEIRPQRVFGKPTLFIKGGTSDYIQEADTCAIKKIFPQAQIVSVPGVGHWVHAEAPQEFAKIVLDFLT